MQNQVRLCLFAATPDILRLRFPVRVLTGTPEELAERSVAWGYDGIEFMPDPLDVPDPDRFARALRQAGAVLLVVNTGRLAAQGLTLFHADPAVARRARQAFGRILDFAGALGAKVGLGIARGAPAAEREAEEVFHELAAHAEQAGTVILLEAAETAYTRFIATMDEVTRWAERVASPGFGVMLDTEQLRSAEPSLEYGIRAAKGRAAHLHLFDPNRWPPGLGPEPLDWELFFRLLREEGFAGSASVALTPEGDPELAARRAAGFLRKHLEAAGRAGAR
jgi:sugar phosphate isomerase/epimerase